MQRIHRITPLATAALLLVSCGGSSSTTTEALLPIASTTTTSSPAAPSTSAEPPDELSELQQTAIDRLVAAYAAADPVAVLDLWTEHGEHYRPDIEFDLAIGGTWSDVECGLDSGGQPRCELLYTNDLLEALDAPPLPGYVRLELNEAGAIADWDYDSGNPATTAAYLQPFADWVGDTDPAAAEVMFDWNGFVFRTQESYSLWTAKADEYLATLG